MVYSIGLPVYISSDLGATKVHFVSSSVKGATPVRVVAPYTQGAEPVRDVGSYGRYMRGVKLVYKVDGIST